MSRAYVLLLLVGCSDYEVNGKEDPPAEVTATLTLDPESADLGVLLPGDVATQTLVLAASGGEVTLGAVRVSGAGFTLVDAPDGETLGDGESRSFDAVFTATIEGEGRGEVTALSDADVGDLVVAILTVDVEAAPEPEIEVDPLTVAIDSGLTDVVTVLSLGDRELVVSDLVVTGDGFVVVNGGGLPGALGVGSEAAVEIGYTGPGGEGLLAIHSDDADEPVVEVVLVGIHSVSCEETDLDGDGSNACDDCDDEDGGRAPHLSEICGDGIDQDCDEVDASNIVLALLPGWGSGSADSSLIWPNFVSTWSSYGTCPVSLVDIASPFDLTTLTASGATALVLTDPAGNSVVYSATEAAAIRDFAEGGYGGLIATYILSWDGWGHTDSWDNSDLADLFGVDPAALAPSHAEGVDMMVTITDTGHPVCDALPSAIQLSPYPYAQGKATATWGDAVLPGASVVMDASDGHMATIVYEGAAWRSVWFTGMADYQTGAPQAMYNAALWTAAR